MLKVYQYLKIYLLIGEGCWMPVFASATTSGQTDCRNLHLFPNKISSNYTSLLYLFPLSHLSLPPFARSQFKPFICIPGLCLPLNPFQIILNSDPSTTAFPSALPQSPFLILTLPVPSPASWFQPIPSKPSPAPTPSLVLCLASQQPVTKAALLAHFQIPPTLQIMLRMLFIVSHVRSSE